jgi:hypothetical protein
MSSGSQRGLAWIINYGLRGDAVAQRYIGRLVLSDRGYGVDPPSLPVFLDRHFLHSDKCRASRQIEYCDLSSTTSCYKMAQRDVSHLAATVVKIRGDRDGYVSPIHYLYAVPLRDQDE